MGGECGPAAGDTAAPSPASALGVVAAEAVGLAGLFTGGGAVIARAGISHENRAKDIRRIRTPSLAVNLYLSFTLSSGNEKILNCSSVAMTTRCGDREKVSASGSSSSGRPVCTSKTVMPTIGALCCLNVISLPLSAVMRFGGCTLMFPSLAGFGGMCRMYAHTYAYVPNHSDGNVLCGRSLETIKVENYYSAIYAHQYDHYYHHFQILTFDHMSLGEC